MRRHRRWGIVHVAGTSMLPTLREGDRLLVRWGGAPRAGRMVVLRLPAGTGGSGGTGEPVLAVKRVLRRDGPGWWVERDNPAEGVDSWQVGAIPDGDVLAAVVCRLPKLRG